MTDNEKSKTLEYLEELTKESHLSKKEISKALKDPRVLRKATTLFKDKGDKQNDNK